MSDNVAPAASESAGFGSQLMGMLNIYIDPAAAVSQIRRKNSWLWPLLIVSIVAVTVQYMSIPTVMRVMQTNPPSGMTAEQLERSLPMIQTVQKVTAFAIPVFMAGMMALSAAVLLGTCSVMGLRSSFRELFSLACHCSLITILQFIAGFIVVRMKGDEIQTLQELQPSFGLGLFIHEGVSKPMMAVLNYFSIFMIWYIVIMSLTVAHMTGSSKGKGFVAAIPSWLLGLLFFVGMSFLQR